MCHYYYYYYYYYIKVTHQKIGCLQVFVHICVHVLLFIDNFVWHVHVAWRGVDTAAIVHVDPGMSNVQAPSVALTYSEPEPPEFKWSNIDKASIKLARTPAHNGGIWSNRSKCIPFSLPGLTTNCVSTNHMFTSFLSSINHFSFHCATNSVERKSSTN